MEQAKVFRTLMDRQGGRGTSSPSNSRALVIRALSPLKLSDAVQNQVEQGGLAPSIAHELSRVDGPFIQARLTTNGIEPSLTRAALTRETRPRASRRKTVGRPVHSGLVPAVRRFQHHVGTQK